MPHTLPRILLIDWDDEFALQLKEAARGRYQIEHLISAPELQQAVQIEPAPVAILLDVDTFRLGTETRLLDLRRLLPNIVYVLLSRAPQVMMELSLDLGPALMVHKDNSLKTLLEMIHKLYHEEATPAPMPEDTLDGPVHTDLPFAQIVTLQRQASIGMLGKNLGNELNNMNTVLMSVLVELHNLTERTMTPDEEQDLLPVLLQDLSWVGDNLRQYADSMVQLYACQSVNAIEVDLKQHVLNTLSTLEGIGKTKYIGINPRLPHDDIVITMSPAHIDHILYNLLVTISNAVANNHTTQRSVDITLTQDGDRRIAQLSFHINAEFEHFRRIEQALSGRFENSDMLAPYIAKRLIDVNGGSIMITPESHGGFSIHVEFPFNAFNSLNDTTSPNMYHDKEMMEYDTAYDEFVRQSTQLK